MEKNPGMFSSKPERRTEMDILDDMGVSKFIRKSFIKSELLL